MKKLFFVLALLLLSTPALAQYTRLGATQIIRGPDNLPDTTAYLKVFKVVLAGTPISLTAKTYRTDSSGYLLGDDGARGIRLLTGAQVWIYSPITILPGISRNPQAGTQYTVPANTATQLEELIYDLTLFGAKGSSLWGLSTGRPGTLAAGTDGYITVYDSTQPLGVRAANPATVLSGTFQPLATPLTQISALSPSNDDILQRKAGAWTNRTIAQYKSDLGLATIATSGSASDLGAGTIPDARFPATLPAASGVNLTALNATNLASGTVPSARVSGSYAGITGVGTIAEGTWQGTIIAPAYLGSGSPSSSNFLRGDGSWQAVSATPAGSGTELQYRNASAFAALTGSSVSGADLTLGGNLALGANQIRLTSTGTGAIYQRLQSTLGAASTAGYGDFNWGLQQAPNPDGTSKNNVWWHGYNVQAPGSLQQAGIAGFYWALESNYRPDVSSRWVEQHVVYMQPDGTERRLQSYTINTLTNNVTFDMRASSFNFFDTTNGGFGGIGGTGWVQSAPVADPVFEYRNNASERVLKLLSGTTGVLQIQPRTGLEISLHGLAAPAASTPVFKVTGTTNLNGNVGIGGNPSTMRLDVVSSATNTAALSVRGGGTVGTANANNGQIWVGGDATTRGSIAYDWNSGDMFIDNQWNDSNGDIIFRARSLGSPVTLLTLQGGGSAVFANNISVTGTSTLTGKTGIGANPNNSYRLDIREDSVSNLAWGSTSAVYGFLQWNSGRAIINTIAGNDLRLGAAGADVLAVTTGARVGVGITNPGSKFQVTGGDVFIDTIASGLVLKSPDGTCYRATMANGGTFSIASTTCP